MESKTKQVSVTVAGTRYSFTLEENFANFILDEFEKNEIFLDQDNRPDKLLKVFLSIASEYFTYEEQIESIIKDLY